MHQLFARRRLALSAALALTLAGGPAAAQGPVELVADINVGLAYAPGSAPVFVASDDLRSWFWAQGPDEFSDLWVTDGTPAGTVLLVEDMAATTNMVQWHYLGGVVLPSGRAVFIGPSGSFPASGLFGHPVGSDGTGAGSARLDLALPESLLVAGDFEEFGGEAWFTARSDLPGAPSKLELWRTDGTSAGTRHAFDASVTPPTDVRGDVVAGGGHVYFSSQLADAVDGASSSVWRTDGSGSAPTLVFTTDPDERVDLHCWLPAVGQVLATIETTAGAPALDPEWWAIGPTGATKLADAAISGSRWCVPNGQVVFMVGRQGSNPSQLFVTDGTVAGTQLIPDNAQQLAAAVGDNPGTAYKDGLICMAWDPFRGLEPAFVNAGGTTVLLDAEPGPASSYVSQFVEYAGEVLFHAREAPTLTGNLFRTDGTVAGTHPVPGADQAGSGPLFGLGRTQAGAVYSFDLENGIGAEPWRTDGFSVTLIDDIAVNPTAGSSVAELTRFGGRLLLSAVGQGTGIEPFVTDGTAAGTQVLIELGEGTQSSYPGAGAAVGGRVAFVAIAPGAGAELVLSDGTTEGSELLDLNPGSSSAQIGSLMAADGRVWFGAFAQGPSGSVTHGLWSTDGSVSGTELVAESQVESQFGTTLIFDAQGVGGASVFFAGVDGAGSELWRSDGTDAGTFRVADLRPGSASSSPRDGVVIDGRLFFTADDGVGGREVWASDGTAVGTVPMAEVVPGPADGVADVGAVEYLGHYIVATPFDAVPSGPVAINAQTGAVGYVVNPLLSTGTPEFGGAATGGFLRVEDTLLFSTVDPSAPLTRAKLWRSTGVTSYATPLPVEIQSGVPLPAVHAGDGHVLFAGIDQLGGEPWRLAPDGSVARLVDLVAGPGGSSPGLPARLGPYLVFGAEVPEVGRELFRTTVATLGANVAEPLVGGCSQSGVVATLAPVGRPTLGADFDVFLDRGTALAPVVWAIDFGFEFPAPGAGCVPLLPAPVFLALGLTDGTGVATIDLGIPADPALLDVQLVIQALMVEVPGPFLGISSLSDGLELVVGP